jgi:hypothetical protein
VIPARLKPKNKPQNTMKSIIAVVAMAVLALNVTACSSAGKKNCTHCSKGGK